MADSAGVPTSAATEAEKPWAIATAAAAERHGLCVTALTALDDVVQAVGCAAVDSKLKTARDSTGQTLVAFEHSLRRLLKCPQGESVVGGGVVHGHLLPSWPPLRPAAASSAFAQLLFHIEQRLLLAHTGASRSVSGRMRHQLPWKLRFETLDRLERSPLLWWNATAQCRHACMHACAQCDQAWRLVASRVYR
jgi:hypothetical protein